MTEEWRPIPVEGYEDLYEVSNTNKIRSIPRVVHKEEDWHNRYGTPLRRKFDAHYSGRELKPYGIYSKGVKYHLHRRLKSGERGQSDLYVYVNEMVRLAFSELFDDEDLQEFIESRRKV